MPPLDPTAPDALRAHQRSEAAAANRPVVAVVGSVVPRELIVAAGCHPVAVMARAEDWGRDSSPMEAGHETETRSLFLQVAGGEFAWADLLIVPGTSDGYRYLFQYLKEVRRQGSEDRIPPLLLFDPLFGPSLAVRRHSRDALQELAQRLQVLAGHSGHEDDLSQALSEALALGNHTRRLCTELDQLRAARRVSGTQAHAAVRAGAFCSPQRHAVALEALRVELMARAPAMHRPRLLLCAAVPLYHERLHALVEQTGAVVTAEDDAWGSRCGAPEVKLGHGPPLEALFDHLMAHAVSPRMPQAEREAWLLQRLRSRQHDGLVVYVPPDDQFFGWRVPALRAEAEQAGVPTFVLRDEVLGPQAAEPPAEALHAYVGRLAVAAASA